MHTEVCNGAAGAVGIPGGADISTMKYKPMVGVLHIFCWNDPNQILLHGLWGGSGGKPHAGTDPQKMGVHRHGGLAVHHIQDDVGSLAPHARQLAKQFHIIGKNAAETFLQDFGETFQMFGFITIKPDRIDKLPNLIFGKTLEIAGRDARPGPGGFQQSEYGPFCARIFRSRRKYCSHEDRKRIVRLRFNELHDRRVMRLKLALQRSVYRWDVL